jgi:hypothetical protein
MKTIALIALLIGTVFTLNAQETTWEGTHRIVSSTDGNGSFNPRKAKTYCQMTEKDGHLTGSITEFGVDAAENGLVKSAGTEKLQGAIDRQIIEWKSGRTWEDEKTGKHHYETIFRGVRDGDSLVGYFEQTWDVQGKAPVTYRGIVDLKKKQGLTNRTIE